MCNLVVIIIFITTSVVIIISMCLCSVTVRDFTCTEYRTQHPCCLATTVCTYSWWVTWARTFYKLLNVTEGKVSIWGTCTATRLLAALYLVHPYCTGSRSGTLRSSAYFHMHIWKCALFSFSMKTVSVGGNEHNLGMVLLPLPTIVFHRFALACVMLSSFGIP